MDPVQVAMLSVGSALIVIGTINRRRREKNAAWLLASGAIIFLLGGFMLA